MNKIVKQTAVTPNLLNQPNVWYLERETGRKYRRIVAGMQWPIANPGALVVVAENLKEDPTLAEHKFQILADAKN